MRDWRATIRDRSICPAPELTLLNELRQVLDLKPSSRPTTIIIARCDDIESTEQFATTIADGQRLHAWTDRQLASLALQLQRINLLQCLTDALRTEVSWNYCIFETNIIPQLGRERLLRVRFLKPFLHLWRFKKILIIRDGLGDARFPIQIETILLCLALALVPGGFAAPIFRGDK